MVVLNFHQEKMYLLFPRERKIQRSYGQSLVFYVVSATGAQLTSNTKHQQHSIKHKIKDMVIFSGFYTRNVVVLYFCVVIVLETRGQDENATLLAKTVRLGPRFPLPPLSNSETSLLRRGLSVVPLCQATEGKRCCF